jgi:hypothetical protein
MLPVDELQEEKLSVELVQLELDPEPELPEPPEPPELLELEELLLLPEPQPAPSIAKRRTHPKVVACRTYWLIFQNLFVLETC